MTTGYNLVFTGSDIYIGVCAFIRYILGKTNNNTLFNKLTSQISTIFQIHFASLSFNQILNASMNHT